VTGERIWTRRASAVVVSAPIVSGGVVVLNVGHGDKYGGGAEMIGVDAATGEQRWDSPLGFSGTAVADQRGRVFVATRGGVLRAVDARTGVTAWRTDLSELQRNRGPYSHIFTINTPVSPTDDRVLVGLSTAGLLLPGRGRRQCGVAHGVGAENCVTSCDLRVFVDEAAKSIMAQNPEVARWSRGCSAVRWRLGQAVVWPGGCCNDRRTRPAHAADGAARRSGCGAARAAGEPQRGRARRNAHES
jgi:hypothetical protein